MDSFTAMQHWFLKKQKVDSVYDIKSFPATFQKLPENNGFTWGYGDKELYRHVLNQYDLQSTGQPSLQVILTVSTHNPFLVNDQQHYLEAFEIRMNALRFSEVQKAEHRRYSKQYASILYADDAIQSFINNYRSRPGFSNTIFIITGDHRMPEIPMSTKIDRYHVPLIIYSPLLKHPQKFESVSLHIDVAPSLLAYLKNSYHLQSPGLVTWVGSGLDTAHEFRNIHASAIKQTKSNLVDFVMGNYHLNDANLFKLSKNMDEEPETNPAIKARLQAAFDRFKQKNNLVTAQKPLLPDSIFWGYYPK